MFKSIVYGIFDDEGAETVWGNRVIPIRVCYALPSDDVPDPTS